MCFCSHKHGLHTRNPAVNSKGLWDNNKVFSCDVVVKRAWNLASDTTELESAPSYLHAGDLQQIRLINLSKFNFLICIMYRIMPVFERYWRLPAVH